MRASQCILIAWLAGSVLRADLISEALFSFPAQTEYAEYDNLAALRAVPNYEILRQRFSGKPLEDAKAALGQLGIPENQVREIVSGTSPKAFYGLAAGTFSAASAKQAGARRGLAVKLGDTQAFCTKQTCVLFLEDSLAAFGPLSSLKEIVEVRQGVHSRMSSNRDAAILWSNSDRMAPVRGLLFGSQLRSSISDTLNDWTGWKRDWSTLADNVNRLTYSVTFDRIAHVAANLQCTSRASAALLAQTLRGLSAVQSITSGDSQIQNVEASSSGLDVNFRADTAILAN